MNRVTLTIHLDLPDGVIPDVSYGERGRDYGPDGQGYPVKQFEPPLPDAPLPDMFSGGQEPARVFPEAQVTVTNSASAPVCAAHGNTMKRWPAGVSKKSNKPFNASWRCSVQDCTVKPLWDRDAA